MQGKARGPLAAYEIACLTAGVPATGDPILDGIIRQGLRYKTVVEFIKRHGTRDVQSIEAALQEVDVLLEKFTK